MKVSIIIANRNDLAMLAVTVASCIEELKPLGKNEGEIVICDNSEDNVFKLLPSVLPTGYCRSNQLKILRQDFPCLFSARESAAKESTGEYILCLDSHMIVGRDMILDLVNFMDKRKDDPTLGFAHAPINWVNHHENYAKHDRDLSNHELGPWGSKKTTECTITWKGMPWICRREWFLSRENGIGGYGALSEHHVSWGGGDMHIGTKPWLLGYKNWAVPTSHGIHIGPFPRIDRADKTDRINGKPVKGGIHAAKIGSPFGDYRYRLYSVSGNFPHTFGFLVACYVLGGEPMMNRNKKILSERFGPYIEQDKWWKTAIDIGSEEKKWLDSKKIMTFEQFLETKPWDERQRDLQSLAS